jgi:GNAT superfamily N-acetyltransferase
MSSKDNPHPPAELKVIQVPQARRIEALRRLALAGRAFTAQQARQFVDFAAANEMDLTQFWAGVDADDQIDQAVLVIPRPGGTGMIFVSRPRRRGLVEQTASVIEQAVRRVDRHQVTLLQALLETTEDLQEAALLAARFKRLATLEYMRRSVGSNMQPPQLPDEVSLEGYTDQSRPLFEQMLEASYEQTLDCPDLHAMRRVGDVLTGHMSVGEFDPRLWTLLKVADEPAGVLLLNRVPEQRCVELVYLGLARAYRGQGFGRLLMDHALGQCARIGQRTLALAMDQRNTPAQHLYKTTGFGTVSTRIALARQVPDD